MIQNLDQKNDPCSECASEKKAKCKVTCEEAKNWWNDLADFMIANRICKECMEYENDDFKRSSGTI